MTNKAGHRIVFISHESSLTGATLLLVNLLKLLKERRQFEFSIVVSRGGRLDQTFKEIAPTIVLKPSGYQVGKSFFGKVIDFFFYQLNLRRVRRMVRNAELIFSNTVANGRVLEQISHLDKSIILYVHELASAIEFCDRHNDSSLSLKLSSVLFSPTEAVSHFLIAHKSVPPIKIFPLNYYFPTVSNSGYNVSGGLALLNQFNIPERSFRVVGMGSASWRKGTDLFVDVCRIVSASNPNIHFTWIGDFLEENFKKQVLDKIEALNLQHSITITGYLPHSPFNLQPFDLLALTSREDPYPLVVLEAAFLGIPAIAFRGTGGMEYFIEDDAGYLTEEVSAQAMADGILRIAAEEEDRKTKGSKAKEKASRLHNDADLVIGQLMGGIQSIARKPT